MNLDFHPVDGIGIFVSFHSVGIIQLPAVGTILSSKELIFKIFISSICYSTSILTLFSFLCDLLLWSGEAKINCFSFESFLKDVFKIDFGALDGADLGFGVSTRFIGKFFSFLCLKYRIELMKIFQILIIYF